MSLQEKMDANKAATAEKAPPEALRVIKQSTQALIDSGLAERALKTGDTAPRFELKNVDGIAVNSADILKKGPMVLAYFRGAW